MSASKSDEIDPRVNRDGVFCHCFSPDKSKIAVSIPDSGLVQVYEITDLAAPNNWQLLHQIKEHSQTVSVLDWSSQNKLLTGSYDRNIVVWSFAPTPKPELVMVQGNNRALLCGEWSSSGSKFAFGTASHKTFVCSFDKENNWWSAIKITGYKSSVLSVAFDPSENWLASGSADFSFKIHGKKLNEKGKEIWEPLYEFAAQSWVEGVAWSSSGRQFAFAVHDASIIFGKVEKQGEELNVELETCQWNKLPFTTLIFMNEDELMAGGYDNDPILFKKGKEWAYKARITVNEFAKTNSVKSQSKVKMLAKSFISNSKMQANQPEEALHLHKNPIICLKKYKITNDFVEFFSTNDINGNIFIW